MKNKIKEIFELYEKQATNPDLAILIKTLKEWYFEKEEYKSRNKKAIEYIKSFGSDNDRKNYSLYYNEIINKVLNILQGEDKDE